jgi:hypothetical protein
MSNTNKKLAETSKAQFLRLSYAPNNINFNYIIFNNQLKQNKKTSFSIIAKLNLLLIQ